MYPFIQEYDTLLTSLEIKELYKRSKYSEETLKSAEIFDRKFEENRVDDSTRKCKEMMLDKETLFWLDSIVTPRINTNKDIEYRLSGVKARIIKYDPSDFFAKHTDVINVHTNLYKCYFLLICLETCEEGGETNIKLDKK